MTAPFSSVSEPMSTRRDFTLGGQRGGWHVDRHVDVIRTPPRCCGSARPDALERLGRGEPLLEVGEDVVDALDADREPHQPWRHTGGQLLLGSELGVRGRRRVDHQRPHVADVGDMAVQRQRVDERLARVDAAGQLEGQHGTGSLWAPASSQLVPRRAWAGPA